MVEATQVVSGAAGILIQVVYSRSFSLKLYNIHLPEPGLPGDATVPEEDAFMAPSHGRLQGPGN